MVWLNRRDDKTYDILYIFIKLIANMNKKYKVKLTINLGSLQ